MTIPVSAVLLVEDDHLILDSTARLLADDGLEVTCASNAEQALAILGDGRIPSILVTDINLDGPSSGLDLARSVAEAWPDVRLILISGETRPAPGHYPEKAVFFTKPYASGALLTLIRSSDW
ncbi:MAG TPA: response regulator [Allosphingosinicella sp.]|nr:response regulator [Allosphingosinicella sp.]